MNERIPIPTKIKRSCGDLLERLDAERRNHPANPDWQSRPMPVIGLFPNFEPVGDEK